MSKDDYEIASVNGIELGYKVIGEGAPLILLHGGFGTVEMFGPNVELLAAGAPGDRRRPPVARALTGRGSADALRDDGR